MTLMSCVKHDLMIAAHQFLFEKTRKDYINKIWAVIEKNDILIEKQAIATSAETSESFFEILLKYFPEFAAGDGSPAKLRCMLAQFCSVNCISFAAVSYLSCTHLLMCTNFQSICSTYFQINSNFQYPFPAIN